MAINKIVYGSATLVDLTGTTATADKILTGYGAFGRDGNWMDGTATQGGGIESVTQDQDGYVVLDDDEGNQIAVNPLSVTNNGTYTAPTGHAYSPVSVNVTPTISTQTKTVSPTTSQQTVSPDPGYDALSSVTVNAMPAGSATAPATITGTGASVTVGTNRLTFQKTVSVTPTVSRGYVASGTRGNSTVQLQANVTTKGRATYHPSTSNQTVSDTQYLTGVQTFNAVTMTNLTAGNIKDGVTIEIGDASDSDCVASVTGTYTGGSNSPVKEKQINFYDYDGTLLYSYTAEEISQLSTLPSVPAHDRLTAQGWNWALADITSQLTALPNGKIYVGRIYTTTSGACEINIELENELLSPYLGICINGTVTIDWGDNTTPQTVTGNSQTTIVFTNHTYSTGGNYTIQILPTSSTYIYFRGNSNASISAIGGVLSYTDSFTTNNAYSGAVKSIHIGETGYTYISDYAFAYCRGLQAITLPTNMTNMSGTYWAYYSGLRFLVVPKSLGGNYAFNGSPNLFGVSVPYTCRNIPQNGFRSCSAFRLSTIGRSGSGSIGAQGYYATAVQEISIPRGITSLPTSAFYRCSSLRKVTMSEGMVTLQTDCFRNCTNLSTVTVPSTVTAVNSAFYGCSSLMVIHMKPTSPPTATSTFFSGVPATCKIYVPYSADHSVLNNYKGASIWSARADYIMEE